MTQPDSAVSPGIDWNGQLLDQLDWHWQHHLRPRLSGLTDDEYFWEPVEGCWNVQPRGVSTAPIQAGSGAFTIDFALPKPDPPPVTTIAWRLGHVIVGVLGTRASNHFGDRSIDYQTFDYAGTAADALHQLDEVYAAWTGGVRALGTGGLTRPCGPDEGPFRRLPDGGAGAAHQPRNHPPWRRDLAAARSVPAPDRYQVTGSSTRPPVSNSSRPRSDSTGTARRMVGNRSSRAANSMCSSIRANGAPTQKRGP